MKNRFGVIFFLVGFLLFSFAGSICLVSKLKAQQVAELIGNIAEEEDETEKEDGSDSEEIFTILNSLGSYHIQLEQHFFGHAVDPLPVFDANTLVQPPEA